MNHGELIVLLSAVITLLGVIFTLFKGATISTGTIKRTKEAERKLGSEHDNLSAEYGKLSAEHDTLNANDQIIINRANSLLETANELRRTLTEVDKRLIEERAAQAVQYYSLSNAHKVMVDGIKEVGKFADEFAKVNAELIALREDNERLRRENDTLKETLVKNSGQPKRDRGNRDQR